MRPADAANEVVISDPVPEAASPVPEDAAPQEPDTSEAPPVPEDIPPQEPGAPAPPVPFTSPSVAVIAPPAGASQDGGAAGSTPAKRRGASFLVVAGIAAVAVIALIVLAVKLIPGLFSGGGSSGIVYLNDDGELMYLADLKEKTEALELTDEADTYSNVQFSPDGKTVYFKDTDSTLYRADVAELKKGGKPERISREVGYFSVLKDGRLLYWQFDSDGSSKLYLYDGTESFRLIRDYYLYQLSEDQKTLYYTERDESDSTLTLYKLAMEKDAKAERLLKGATTIHTGYDAATLVYSVKDSGGSGSNTRTVYSCTPGGDKTKLVDEVYSITGVTVDSGKVDFYYYVKDEAEYPLYDFVTDSKASEDAETLSVDEPEYPYWDDYDIYEIWIDDEATAYSLGVVYYINGKGEECPIDVSGLLAGTGLTLDDLYGMYWEVYDIAYEDAMERFNAASEDYYARYDAWWAAQDRENMREYLKETQYTQSSYSLYHYTGSGKGEAIATGLRDTAYGSAADGIFLYRKADLESGKVADVADLDYFDEVYDMLNSGSGGDENVWYQNVGGKESVIDLDEDFHFADEIPAPGQKPTPCVLVLNDKEVVLWGYEGDEPILMSYSLGKEALTFNSTIAEDNFSKFHQGKAAGKDVLYLFTDMDGDYPNRTGDFCVYKDGKLETIAKEIYGAYVLNGGDTIYVVPDEEDKYSGDWELALLKDGKTTTISDEVSGQPVFLDEAQLLYFSDGDLMLWDGKENRRIARDVEKFWASASEEYSSYNPV